MKVKDLNIQEIWEYVGRFDIEITEEEARGMDIEELMSKFGSWIKGKDKGTYIWIRPDGCHDDVESKEDILFQLGFTESQKNLSRKELLTWLNISEMDEV